MKISIVASILAVLSAVACAPAAENPPPTTVTSADVVEGRRYEASGTLPDGTKVSTVLAFAHGQLDSTACDQMGFAPGAYTVAREGDAITFRAPMKNKEGKVEVWTGKIVGDTIDGNVTFEGKTVNFRGNAVR